MGDVATLQAMVDEIRRNLRQDDSSHGHKKKKKDRKKGKRSSHDRSRGRRDRRRRRGHSSSGSSSGSSRDSDGKSVLRWRRSNPASRSVSPSDLAYFDGRKWKKPGDFVAFCQTHPGALTAHFLVAVHAKCARGTAKRLRDLDHAPASVWAASLTGLTEMRDLREVRTLCQTMDLIKQGEVERGMDTISARINAIQAAKAKGGSWEKAERIELIPGSASGVAPGGLAALLG